MVNSQQLQVLKASGKVSSVGALVAGSGGDQAAKVSLVNVRDVVQYMPQIRYMMSKLTTTTTSGTGSAAGDPSGGGGGDLSHAHSSSKRQRVS